MTPPLLGVDIGSTTVKVVIVPAPGAAPTVATYSRHRGDPIAALREALSPHAHLSARPFVTGSNAPLVADRWGTAPVHEVSAVTAAVRRRHPRARVVVELGGQDAKLIAWPGDGRGGQPSAAMNDRCAAGTGVTIDRCLRRLGVTGEEAAAVSFDPTALHPVSSKCGVFAETDMVNLMRRGVPVPQLVSSLADSIVRQVLAVLARGVDLSPPVVLLGGPHVYLPALVGAWRHHLGAEATVPDHALYHAALGACDVGAVREADGRAISIDALVARFAPRRVAVAVPRTDAPFEGAWPSVGAIGIDAGSTAAKAVAAIGIDAGSTAAKAVAMNARGEVLARAWCASRAPVDDARTLLAQLSAQLGDEGRSVAAASVGVTGYASGILAPVLDADVDVVETVAHAESARAALGDVDVVCDVGGQDIKIIQLARDGVVRAFWLSSQCSAGIGALLEAVAADYGVTRDDYAARAFAARRAAWFGDPCVVLMDSARVGYQRMGFAPQEVLAGLARAVPRVVWSQVTNGVAPASLGRRFALQGGAHCNPAVARAQIEFLREHVPGAHVALHPHAADAGAIGAALMALRAAPRGRSTAPRRIELETAITVHTGDDTRCRICPSECPRTFVEVGRRDDSAVVHVTGHGCAEGAAIEPPRGDRAAAKQRKRAVPNLLAEETQLLFPRGARANKAGTPRARVGIPRVLALYRCAPLLRVYLEALDVDVVFSPATDQRLWRAGARHGANDPCFPIKVVHAHVHHLLTRVHDRGRRLDAVVFPHVTHAVTPVRHVADSASCVVVTAAPSLVRSAFAGPRGALSCRGVQLLDPLVTVTRPDLLARQLYEGLAAPLGASRGESDEALAAGMRAMAQVTRALKRRGREILDGVAARRWPAAALVLARPYHTDPGLNHHIGDELAALGLPAMSIAQLPDDAEFLRPLLADELARGAIADPYDIRDLLPGCANSGAAERVWAARIATRHPRMAVVDLSSFKCGQDSPTYGPIRDLVERSGVPYLALHDLDETRPVTSLRVRLRTFAHTLTARGMLP